MKLPCELIRDLLPSYIDNLESEVSKKEIEEHLKTCEECTKIFQSMQEVNIEKENRDDVENKQDETVIIKKVRKKMNKKIKIAIGAGVIAVVLAVGMFELLFNAVIKEVPRQEVKVTANVYPLKELATEEDTADETYSLDQEEVVKISGNLKNMDTEKSYSVSIPELPNSHLLVSQNILDQYENLTLMQFQSPYFLREVLWDIQEVNGQKIVYIKHFRTTVLNNSGVNSGSYTTSIEFGTVSKIIYLENDGSETVLWEYQEK